MFIAKSAHKTPDWTCTFLHNFHFLESIKPSAVIIYTSRVNNLDVILVHMRDTHLAAGRAGGSTPDPDRRHVTHVCMYRNIGVIHILILHVYYMYKTHNLITYKHHKIRVQHIWPSINNGIVLGEMLTVSMHANVLLTHLF